MSQKRNRSINWVEEEKQLFRSVLKDYAQVIENKSLDTNTNKIKTKAWEEVHKKFNQLNSRPRDLSQLKIQWKAMKINARKTFSTFKKEINKTGGGARPTTPDDSIVEIKDLLNPAELLRDHNLYDSDGIVIEELQCIQSLDSCVNNNTNVENQQLAKMCIDTINDVDAQVAVQEFTPLAISQVRASTATPMKKYMDTLPVKISEDDIIMITPKKSTGIILENKITSEDIPKQKNKKYCKQTKNNIMGNSRKEQDDYVSSMLTHSKMLKDEEHMRRMEMADEEHAIKMAIHREKLKSAVLEREILELKKDNEALK